jgi:Domain of unknown function (DUF3846)
MKAILIDSVNRSVKEVDYDGSLDSLRRFVKCECVTVAFYRDNGDAVFVDDEGLLKSPENFFELGEYPEPLAGNALIVGTKNEDERDLDDEDDSDSTSCRTTAADIQDDVVFLDLGTVLAKFNKY